MWLGDNGYIKSNCLGSISNKSVINIARKGYVYDKNGKRLKSYRGGKATVTRNQKIKYAGKLTETSRELYYYVGSGAYVKAKDVSQKCNVLENQHLCLQQEGSTYQETRYFKKRYFSDIQW